MQYNLIWEKKNQTYHYFPCKNYAHILWMSSKWHYLSSIWCLKFGSQHSQLIRQREIDKLFQALCMWSRWASHMIVDPCMVTTSQHVKWASLSQVCMVHCTKAFQPWQNSNLPQDRIDILSHPNMNVIFLEELCSSLTKEV